VREKLPQHHGLDLIRLERYDHRTVTHRDLILRLTASFVAGEEAVTLDILPLIMTVAREGRVEEELYLTTFLFEEAKHTDFFRRFLDALPGDPGDLARFRGVVESLAPASLYPAVYWLRRYGFLILFVAMFTGVLRLIMVPVSNLVLHGMLWIIS